MRDEFTWMLFLILPLVMVRSLPLAEPELPDEGYHENDNKQNSPMTESKTELNDEEVISVSITSSIAIGRGGGPPRRVPEPVGDLVARESAPPTPVIEEPEPKNNKNNTEDTMSLEMAGANVEFIKQLHSKKEARGTHHFEQVHPFQFQIKNHVANDTREPIGQNNLKENIEITDEIDDEIYDIQENIENVPLGRSVALSPSSQNSIQGQSEPLETGQRPRLTTVSFSIVHDTPTTITNYNAQKPVSQTFPDVQQAYSEPPKIYSRPAQVYSEPAKIYSEPAKIYSEPAKVYSEPAKVYGEPAKIYSEPAKFYSPAASLNLPKDIPLPTPWQPTQPSTILDTTVSSTELPTTLQSLEIQPSTEYQMDEKENVLNGGQRQDAQESSQECKDESCKVGYVVEGRQYRKYQIEERTSDGFIVGEYGVVRNEDGALRGVRYTADGAASPRLIQDALIKFLQL